MKEVRQKSRNRHNSNGRSAGYVKKHLDLIKQYWLQLELLEDSILEDLEHPSNQDNPDHQIKACHLMLWGTFNYLDGDTLLGYRQLLQAEQILKQQFISPGDSIPKSDLYAYLHCEMGNCFYVLHDIQGTWNHLHLARSFARSEKLKAVINTLEKSIWHNRFYMDVIPGDMSELDANLDFLRTHGIHYGLIVGLYYRMGINLKLDHMDGTFDNYFEGSGLCQKLDLDTYLASFHMARGIWYANHKEWQAALKCYREAYSMTESYYRQTLCLENTASLYERYQDHDKREDALLKMMGHCEKYNVIQKIPAACLHLAHHYLDVAGDVDLAKHYFKKGYDAAIEMQDQGIQLYARAARIVREFPEFMEKHYLIHNKFNHSESKTRALEFCLNHSWHHIKNVFQHALLVFQREQSQNSQELLDRLQLKLCTLQAIRHKLIKSGFEIPDLRFSFARTQQIEIDPAMSIYCQEMVNLDWKKANARFQNDALGFLLKHHHNNKLQLSKQLKVSYPTIIKMLKSLPNTGS